MLYEVITLYPRVRRPSAALRLVCRSARVITSYSIHYTKLYDDRGLPAEFFRRDQHFVVHFRCVPFTARHDVVSLDAVAEHAEPAADARVVFSYNFV